MKAQGGAAGLPIPAEGEPFWRRKPLEEMTSAEWESLCDGCARCCLNKLEEEETGVIHFTSVACTLLDGETCRCRDYDDRQAKVPDCVRLTPEDARSLPWLPPTCAYRLVAEGHDLYWWHPLVSGAAETVHQAGISVRGRITAWEHELAELQDLEDHLADWPGEAPEG
ncbi:YcgN family cysteine cluster protein [Phreatobacter sp. AB_2022a]|uniref:YcgN family cysteine cluster protein n=1 Tax=Phreatobacter sp. AB_2022a TaxID=3003134 RepID=UPI0022874C24|nr:YcgN family cysteine cluster protein [Phreatobacter sp. AB_2022a]MCZ0737018.1 YcgN family cysteine cluster protein [Phreatobacter sp. AB_2022a]